MHIVIVLRRRVRVFGLGARDGFEKKQSAPKVRTMELWSSRKSEFLILVGRTHPSRGLRIGAPFGWIDFRAMHNNGQSFKCALISRRNFQKNILFRLPRREKCERIGPTSTWGGNSNRASPGQTVRNFGRAWRAIEKLEISRLRKIDFQERHSSQ